MTKSKSKEEEQCLRLVKERPAVTLDYEDDGRVG